MKRLVLLAVTTLVLQACALDGVIAPPYMQEGERTFTAPIEEVRDAARRTLTHLDMKLNEDSTTADGRQLRASTWDRTVRIDLENVTYNMTKMTVSVTKADNILKDHSTEQEILEATGHGLVASGATLGAARIAH
ncbi:MAG TPA: hypothetical protein VGB82_21615 [Alphaproteobacteria bacterium]